MGFNSVFKRLRLRLWVRIPPGHGYLSVVSVVCFQVEVFATRQSLVQTVVSGIIRLCNCSLHYYILTPCAASNLQCCHNSLIDSYFPAAYKKWSLRFCSHTHTHTHTHTRDILQNVWVQIWHQPIKINSEVRCRVYFYDVFRCLMKLQQSVCLRRAKLKL